MSFGFLTESALLPSKSKPIRVDGRSLVDLKAVVYAKEQKVKLEGGGGSGSGGLRGLRGKRRAAGDAGERGERKDPFARSNRGVEDRSQRDELERVTASKKRKAAQKVMAAKSSLYEKMAKGEVAGASRAGSLVDFSRKTGDDLALLEAKARKPKSRRHKSDPGADSNGDDDYDDDDGSSGKRSKSSKKRQRSGRAGGSGGKGRGGGGRSDSSGEDDDSAHRRGGFSSDDDDDDDDDGDGGGGYGAEVEIVDEFGRHRAVARGSREHREHLQAKKRAAQAKAEQQQQQQQQQQSRQTTASAGLGSSSFDERYSYRGNRGAPPPPPPLASLSYAAAAAGGDDVDAPPGGWAWSSGAGRGADAGDFETREGQERQARKGMAELLEREGGGDGEADRGEGGAKILSQWEKTLTGDQKTYLREVQQETEAGRRRATATGGDRKADREKHRAERKELLRRKQEARVARMRGEKA